MERKTILCATDLRQSGGRAADLAVQLARATGCGLELIHVADLGVGTDADAVDPEVRPAAEALRQRIRQRIEGLATELETERQRCAAQGVECDAGLEEGRPWETIVAAAARREPKMLVVGPHASSLEGHHGLRDRVMGTTAGRVVHHAPCAVLVAGLDPVSELRQCTWLVGVDFSARSVDAIKDVVELVEACGGRLVLCHVLSAHHYGSSDETPTGWGDLLDWWKRDAHARLQAEARAHAPGMEVETRVEEGRPEEALARVASEIDAHVIAVGSHGHGPLTRVLLGSTAERCLRRARRPVLVVRRAEVGRE